jgi:hypothetical protein
MNLVVIPLTAIPPSPLQFKSMIIGASILVVAAGLPMVVSFDRFFSKWKN